MSFEASLAIDPSLHSFVSIDYNNDGLEDIYASYLHHISIFLNDANHTFTTEISIFQDDNLYMDELALVDIDNNGSKDYVWSGTNSTLAYHLNTNNMATHEIQSSSLLVYPNPSQGKVFIKGLSDKTFSLKIYSLSGKTIYRNSKIISNQPIDLSFLPTGKYLIEIIHSSEKHIEKLVIK